MNLRARSDPVVAFENMEYGNAVYIMMKDWKEAGQKTKQQLLTTGKEGKDFFRVVHGKGWKTLVKSIVQNNRS